MTTGTLAGILSWGALRQSDRSLVKLLDFMGVPHTHLDVSESTLAVSQATSGGLCPIVSATTLRQALAAGAPAKDLVRRLIERAPATLIHQVTPDALSHRELSSLVTGVAIPTWLRPDSRHRYRVHGGHRDVCGTFSGLAWSPIAWKERVPAFDRNGEFLDTLIAVEDSPVFLRRRGSGETFLLCGPDVVDLDERVRDSVDVHRRFIEVFPYLMFLRRAFPNAAWHPGSPYGSLIIDDPPLRPRHGFLNFRRLAQSMDEVGFSTDIAMIPWNVSRTTSSVAALIHARRDRFGVSIHGCDHTRSEFGGTDSARLAQLATLAVSRMEAHRRQHRLDYERIMVFPQGVFSPVAMEVLQNLNFLAAVNTEVVPSHNTNRDTTLTLADALRPVITRYGGFPLFPRRKCSDHPVNFAADLFLGKPCLLVSHHIDFADGGKAIVDLVTAIRAVAPNLEWATLGTVLRRTHQWARQPDGSRLVNMLASELILHGDDSTAHDVHVVKTVDRQSLADILVNDLPTDVRWNADRMTIPVTLRPRQNATIRLVYHNRFSGTATRLGASYRFKAALRRSLCDIRDNYVDIVRHRFHGFSAHSLTTL